MKKLLVLALFCSLQASAATYVCISAMVSPDGTVGGIYETGAPQVLVLQDGKISPYLVKDPKVIWAAKYKISSPFSLSWVTPFGNPGTYTPSDKFETKWVLSQAGTLRTDALLSVDTISLKAEFETENWDNGSYTGGSQATMPCGAGGVAP